MMGLLPSGAAPKHLPVEKKTNKETNQSEIYCDRLLWW
jgi:hypothetical protein